MAEKYLLNVEGDLRPYESVSTIGVNKRIYLLKPNDERSMSDGRIVACIDDYDEYEVKNTRRVVMERAQQASVLEDATILDLERPADAPAE